MQYFSMMSIEKRERERDIIMRVSRFSRWGRMESNEGEMDTLKGFSLRGRNEDHTFTTLQAFRDAAIINRIMLPRKTSE